MSRALKGFSTRIRWLWLLAATAGLVAVMTYAVGNAATGRSSRWAFPASTSSIAERGAHVSQPVPGHDLGAVTVPHSAGECHRSGSVYLGITYLPVTEVVAQHFGLDALGGALITEVEPNSPAAKAGVQPDDIIVEFGGLSLTPSNSLAVLQSERQSGEQVSVKLLRQQELLLVYVTLVSMGSD